MKTMMCMAAALLVALSVAVPDLARADWEHCCLNPVRWASDTVNLDVRVENYPVGSIGHNQIVAAAEEWTDLGDSAVNIVIGSDTDGTVGPDNGQSEIYRAGLSGDSSLATVVTWTTNTCVSGAGAPVCCGCNPSTIVESDMIIFDQNTVGGVVNNIPWSAIDPGRGSDPDPTPIVFKPAIQHELGHMIGIQHTNNGLVRMSSAYPVGGWFFGGGDRTRPHVVDRLDAQAIYPDSASGADVYMSNVADIGGISRQLSWGSSVANFYPRRLPNAISGQASNVVRRGDALQVNLCGGNLGPSTNTVTVDVYLSLDRNFLPSNDLPIANVQRTFAGYTSECWVENVTIPNNTAHLTYWVIFGHGTGGNNLAIINRQVQVIP